MAAVSLSPSPVHLSAMSTRRVPLSSNPNVANSPLRNGSVLAAAMAKHKRSYASTQREEAYGQHPPPAKKQMLNNAAPRAIRSPSKPRPAASAAFGNPAAGIARVSAAERERILRQQQKQRAQQVRGKDKDLEQIEMWVASQRSSFPQYVFYFDPSVPDDVRARLVKQLNVLNAREEKFFSISITHVVTTRSIPKAAPAQGQSQSTVETNVKPQQPHKQPQTINPSLLSRTADLGSATRRLFDVAAVGRRPPIHQPVADAMPKPKASKNVDILDRALAMGKKIWTLEKMQRVVNTILEPDPQRRYELASRVRTVNQTQQKALEDGTLLQLLNKERVSGPSDRDSTVSNRELHHFKGPFLYIYDIEEKNRPIMVREYNKVPEKNMGDWPQFRATTKGRCPFLIDEPAEKARKEPRVAAAPAVAANRAVDSAPRLEPPLNIVRPRPMTGKRSLAEMEDAGNRGVSISQQQSLHPGKMEFSPAFNALTSRARPARLQAGEPVASGVQPSGVTSAIRSNMVSSTTGAHGAKSGLSREVMGLQRMQVPLQKSAAVNAATQEYSSRRHGDVSADSGSFIRSASMGAPSVAANTTATRSQQALDEVLRQKEEKHRRTQSVPTRLQPKPKKRDPKPGYCENCQDKFQDFDEHILSRTHRKFAENDDNWGELDSLLRKLSRPIKDERNYDEDYTDDEEEEVAEYDDEEGYEDDDV